VLGKVPSRRKCPLFHASSLFSMNEIILLKWLTLNIIKYKEFYCIAEMTLFPWGKNLDIQGFGKYFFQEVMNEQKKNT
jgi:hypothetical protein